MAITASLIAPIIPAYSLGGCDLPMINYNEGNSATYKQGAPLVDSSSVYVESTSSISTSNLMTGFAVQAGQNIASAPVYPAYGVVYPSGAAAPTAQGVAQGSSTAGVALASAPLMLCLALPNMVFEGTFANNGSDVAINTTDVFISYGITKDATSGFWYINKNLTSSNAGAYVIGVREPGVDTITFGTTKGARVLFTVRSTFTRFN